MTNKEIRRKSQNKVSGSPQARSAESIKEIKNENKDESIEKEKDGKAIQKSKVAKSKSVQPKSPDLVK